MPDPALRGYVRQAGRGNLERWRNERTSDEELYDRAGDVSYDVDEEARAITEEWVLKILNIVKNVPGVLTRRP